jgi:hypothetical protein
VVFTRPSGQGPAFVYVQHHPWALRHQQHGHLETGAGGPNALQMVGTLVVEGNVADRNKTEICTGGDQPSPPPTNPCWASPLPTGTSFYGYPMAVLAYDPKLPYPTVSPYAPQGDPNTPTLHVGMNFGTPNTVINGIVYSGGRIEFNPINVNGSTVGFDIDVQGTSSTYQYIPTYGNASPPPGFPAGSSGGLILKSFIAPTSAPSRRGRPPVTRPPAPDPCRRGRAPLPGSAGFLAGRRASLRIMAPCRRPIPPSG